MKHPFFHRGIMQAYDRILPSDMIPAYFISLEVDPAEIDINIHPTKTEIKFENESALWKLLHATVREGLGKFNVIPSIDFDQSGSVDIPIALKSNEGLSQPEISINPNYNPFEEQKQISISSPGFSSNKEKNQLENWEKLYGDDNVSFELESEPTETQTSFIEQSDSKPAEQCKNFILFKNKYILTPVKSGLMVIDQRRAHQRILFEQMMYTLQNHESVSQQLLFPETFETNSSDAALLLTMLEDLNTLGFDIREFGPGTFIINGIPGMIENTNVKGIIEGLLEEYKNSASNLKERAKEHLATSLAFASSIDPGSQLSQAEADSLIDKLFACQTPNFSPLGKTIIEIIQTEEIEKRLK